jgi:DNA invertase Pin-like site-specific DNA recombinase
MKRVFAYLGIPEQFKSDEYRFNNQLARIKQYARQNRMGIDTVFFEYLTYSENDYPECALLVLSLEKIRPNIRTVLIESLDRISDNIIIQETVLRDLRSKGFSVISTLEGEVFSINDTNRKIIRQVLDAAAKYDRNIMVAKLQAARKRKKATGKKADGRRGYKDTKEGRSLIQRINNLRRKAKYKRRMTLQQVADILNKEGITTMDGKEWTLYRVQQVINSEKK